MGIFFGGNSNNNDYLGVDIGSSSIKIVELKKEKRKLRLSTYGFSENLHSSTDSDWQKDIVFISKIINKICDKAGTTTRNVVAALPAFSVFSSILNLSNVDKKDMSSAVHWEAKKVIPLPLDEMVLDWRIVVDDDKSGTKKINDKNRDTVKNIKNAKVLLTGAPKTLVKKYISIFKEAKINLLSLETETFSLIRSLLGNDKSTIMIVEIGMSTTDISIIDNCIPLLNRSIDIGGMTITKAISNSLNIGIERAEQFKYDLGISSIESDDSNAVPKAIINIIDPIVNEIKYMLNLFKSKNNKTVEKIVLSGGSSLLSNFVDYLSKIINMKVIIGDPWSMVSCPVELMPSLSELGPKLSVAIGSAMREIE